MAHAQSNPRITQSIAIQTPFPRYARKCTAGTEKAASIDEDRKNEGEDVDGADDYDVVELTGLEGLVYMIARGDEKEGGEEDGEEGECCGVEDAEEGDM